MPYLSSHYTSVDHSMRRQVIEVRMSDLSVVREIQQAAAAA